MTRKFTQGIFLLLCGLFIPIMQGHSKQFIDPELSQVKTSDAFRYNAQETNANLLLGNPSNAKTVIDSTSNYLMYKHGYVLSYNNKKGIPNWVSWHVQASDLGKIKRKNSFRPDSSLPASWHKVSSKSYAGSGFDRGHNCPSRARTASKDKNSETFLMTNIIPQSPKNNQRTWAGLESYVHDRVKAGYEAYIIMGAYGQGGSGKNGKMLSLDQGSVLVPSNIWKVVLLLPLGENDLARINEQTEVIAINTPNHESIHTNWKSYICTVRDIEKATGYNLFSVLPESLQAVLETRKFAA